MSNSIVNEKSKKKNLERLCYHYMKALNCDLVPKTFSVVPYVSDKTIYFNGLGSQVIRAHYSAEVRLYHETYTNTLVLDKLNTTVYSEYNFRELKNNTLSSVIQKLLEFGTQDIFNYNNKLMYTEEFIIYLCDLLQDQLNKKVGGTLSFSFKEYKGDSSYEGVIWNDAKFVSSTVCLNEKPLIYFIEFLEEDSDVEKLKKEMIHATAKKLLRWVHDQELFYEAGTEPIKHPDYQT